MQTKQKYLVAKFTARHDNAKNDHEKRELTSYYKLIDKKTERVIVDCRMYMGKSASASAVHCSLWVQYVKNAPETWSDGYASTSGSGVASGYGYHKSSAALASAISSAGIELWGSPYCKPVNSETPADMRKRMKQRAHIGGTGTIEGALSAIAYAAGYKDCIFVQG